MTHSRIERPLTPEEGRPLFALIKAIVDVAGTAATALRSYPVPRRPFQPLAKRGSVNIRFTGNRVDRAQPREIIEIRNAGRNGIPDRGE